MFVFIVLILIFKFLCFNLLIFICIYVFDFHTFCKFIKSFTLIHLLYSNNVIFYLNNLTYIAQFTLLNKSKN